MGTIIKFPADAAMRRPGMTMGVASVRDGGAAILILPAIRIEREFDGSNGQGPEQSPEQGTAPGRRRKRRARS
jgi:hypothetical protein